VKRPRSGRRAPLVVLFLALACLAVWTGPYGAAINRASAAEALLAFNRSPAAGATAVAVDTNISVKFNVDVDPVTINAGTFYMTMQGLSSPVAGVTLSYSSGSYTATMNPGDDLLPGTTYVVTLTDGVATGDGLALSNAGDWSFTTDTQPEVLAHVPAAGATDCAISQNISVTFDRPMDQSTLNTSSFRLEKLGGSSVTASVSLSADRRTAVLNPTFDLAGGETYVATLTSALKSESGLSVSGAPVQWTFTTVVGPTVVTKVPANGAVNQAVNQTISAVFSQDMDQSTITTATFYLAKTGGSPLPATLAYSAGTRTATLTPLATYEPGATYRVTLSTAVRGVNGAALVDTPVTWTFSVVSDAPSITSRGPDNGATGVSVTQSIQAAFDADMIAATITSATFYVQPVGGSPVPATVTYSATTHIATVDPTAPLDNGKTYQVTLSAAVQGQGGLPVVGAPVIWFFTTEAGASTFTDVVPGVTPYSEAIAELADREAIAGFVDGSFRPNDLVTRQQFAKMIVLSLKLPVAGSEICPFRDVAAQTGSDPFYPSKYVAVCATYGITQGKTATTFAPYENISRQQLITMIVRAAEASTPPIAFATVFTSAQFSTSEHYQNARKGAYVGLLDELLGIGPTYSFLAGSTRGECAQLLYNLVNYLG
jgi:hypothetical protein